MPAGGARLSHRGRTQEEAADTGGNGIFCLPKSGVDLETVERDLIRQALERTGGNGTRAAQLLGLSRDQWRDRVAKHQITQP